MKRAVFIVIGVILAVASVPVSAQRQQIGDILVTGWSEQIYTKENVVTIVGPRVRVQSLSAGVPDGRLDAKAAKMVVTLGAGQGGPSLRTVTLAGDVWVLTKPQQGRSTEVRSERAEVDWAGARMAYLTGNVRVQITDASVFADPLTVNADKATMNLKPESQLKPGEFRIKIESDPDKSRLEFTPLPPQEPEQK